MDSNTSKNGPVRPDCDDLEIDKIPGAWVVTYWMREGVTLRLRIRHTSSMEPNDFVAEVRIERNQEFQLLHQFELCVYDLAHPNQSPNLWNELPTIRRREFAAMAQVSSKFLSRYHQFAQDAVDVPVQSMTVNHTEVLLSSLSTEELKVIQRVLQRTEAAKALPAPSTDRPVDE